MLESERSERILAELQGVPPMTLDELVSATGIEKGLAFDTVRFLKDAGYVDALEATAMGTVNFIEIKLSSRGRALVEKQLRALAINRKPRPPRGTGRPEPTMNYRLPAPHSLE